MNPIKLRPATPFDMPQIIELHRQQNERDGTNYPLTLTFRFDGTLSPATPIALVAEENGEPKQAIYVERRAELLFAGCDPKATAYARKDIEALVTALSWMGYHGLHCEVPIGIVEMLQKPLEAAGFIRTDDKLAHFYKELET